MIIAIEGLDSSGKSTQVDLLKKYLTKKGIDVETWHFPTKTSYFGREIYDALAGNSSYSPEVIELLHTADKMNMQQYLKEFKHNDQRYLILDRYQLSQYAYALANGFDEEWTINLMKLYIQPDVRIYLNITPEESMSRKQDLDKYESDIEFLKRVAVSYKDGCNKYRYYVIDGNDSKEKIHEIIKNLVGGF